MISTVASAVDTERQQSAAATQAPVSIIRSSGLFDQAWYEQEYPWVVEQGIDALQHYCSSGERNGRCPNRLFDPLWYRSRYLNGGSGGLPEPCCLLHYIQEGRQLGFLPGPRFNPVLYVEELGNSAPPVADALSHWMEFAGGVLPKVDPQAVLEHDITLTGLFLADWYSEEYPDVNDSGMTPLEHYACIGINENRLPNPYLDPLWYLTANPHVAESSVPPIFHYAQHGFRNGRVPSLRFSGRLFDNRSGKRDPLNDYLRTCRSDTGSPDNCSDPCVSRFANGPYNGSLPVDDGNANRAVVGKIDRFDRDYLSEPGFQLLSYYAQAEGCTVAGERQFSRRLSAVLKQPGNRWLRGAGRLETLAAVFHPRATDSGCTVLDGFLHFVESFDQLDSIPCGFFDASYYRHKTGSSGSDTDCLREWILQPDSKKIIPTLVFDANVYRRASNLRQDDEVVLFRHWLATGLFANRSFHRLLDLGYIRRQLQGDDRCAVYAEYVRSEGVAFDQRHAGLFIDGRAEAGVETLNRYFLYECKKQLPARLESGSLRAQIEAAAGHDSKVLRKGVDINHSLPPFNTLFGPVVKQVRRQLAKK